MRKTEENAKASSMLVRCAAVLRCLMKYNPTQSAIAHNPFRSALRAGKNIQRPAKLAEAWCTYSSHSKNDTARPLTTMIAPTTGRGLISACSMQTIKSQKSILKAYRARREGGNMTSEYVTRKQSQSDLATHMSSFPATRPGGSSWALPKWKEHRGTLPVLPVGVPEESDQVVFFKLNSQEDVARRCDGK